MVEAAERFIIAGGRGFDDYFAVALAAERRIGAGAIIVSGGARGADRLGEEFAEANGFKVEKYPADWDKHGKRAGYIRNEEMARNADVLLAFWDGQSRGTKHMIDIALREGIETHVFFYARKKP